MTLSKCFRGSGEKLSCISCHDPHVEPRPEEAAAYFKKKCLACHTEKSCTLPLQIREHQRQSDDCADCHMQKRDVREISHSSIKILWFVMLECEISRTSRFCMWQSA